MALLLIALMAKWLIVSCGVGGKVAAGEIKAEKHGRDWMIDAESVEERKRKSAK